MTDTFEEAFWRDFWRTVAPPNSNGCRFWKGKRPKYNRDGKQTYPAREYKGEKYSVHVMAWRWDHGKDPLKPVPDGHVIMHICDEPSCCEPSHLLQGTQSTNLHDAHRKGRAVILRGEKSPVAKLNDAIVRKVRREYADSQIPFAVTAKRYDVTEAAIRGAVRGKTWGHITDPPATPYRR